MPEVPSNDPILSRSLSGAILISSFLLVLSLAWALYDEMFGLRPWRSYQRRFAAIYAQYLKKEIPKQKKGLDDLVASAEYQRLSHAYKAAFEAAKPGVTKIDDDTKFVNLQLSDITDAFTTARGKVQALTYQVELEPVGTGSRKKRESDVATARPKINSWTSTNWRRCSTT